MNEIKKLKIKPLALIILDGWGVDQPNKGNAVTLAKTPTMDKLSHEYPYAELRAHGKAVGLPEHQVGNSEAGHENIGAGRIVHQDVVKISRSISNGTFFKNAAFLQAVNHVQKNNSDLHLMGMLSNGMSPHSDPDHLLALLTLARNHNIKNVYAHIFTDGRDSPQHAALKLTQDLKKKMKPNERIVTLMGRYYGMDRKKSWTVTEEAYDALTCEKCRWHQAEHSVDAVTESYNRGNTDEFMEPYVIFEGDEPLARIGDNDSVIFFNLRSDRGREITKAFVQKDFEKMNHGSFKRKNVLKNLCFVAMTDFGPDLDPCLTAYPSSEIDHTLPMQLTNKRQIYMAETEKYAHVTYFFNGGYPDPIGGEERIMVLSPNVKSYDTTPTMSSAELTNKILSFVKQKSFDFMTVNFACPDMIGHTGNLQAGIKAIEGLDRYLGQVINKFTENNISAIVTADHGNIEQMINLKTGEVMTEHTTNPVPFILFDNDYKFKKDVLRRDGKLGDIAPTVLDLFNLKQPKEMRGKSLIK